MDFRFSLKNLKAPTPKKMVRFGNALAALSTTVAIPAGLSWSMWGGIFIGALGGLGKFITMFWTEDTPETKAEDAQTHAETVAQKTEQAQ
jgi:hypothetical protein